MFSNPIFLLGISTFFASVPVAIWLYLLFRKGEKSKKIITLVFLLGCLTAPALLGIQYLWDIFPNFNLAAFIEDNVQSQSGLFIATFLLFAALEEIFKMYVIVAIDKRTQLIKTIGDSIRYSVASALAFSFIENVYYLYQFWPSIGLGQLMGMYIFRSIFTTCAHMIFSGIFGYYYGVGKYSMYITKQTQFAGAKHRIAKVISNIFNLPLSQAFQQQIVLKGLVIAIVAHTIFNYLLQFNVIIPVILAVVLGYLFLRYLLNRKAGHLILESDISEQMKSTMAKRDEEVVMELMGMWFQEKRYVDVIHVCERLLERDPDNEVVKLFKARAMDKLDDKNIYKKIIGTVIKTKDDLSENDKNLMAKYLNEKAQQPKTAPQQKKEEQTPTQTPPKKKNVLDNYTGDGEFKLNI